MIDRLREQRDAQFLTDALRDLTRKFGIPEPRHGPVVAQRDDRTSNVRLRRRVGVARHALLDRALGLVDRSTGLGIVAVVGPPRPTGSRVSLSASRVHCRWCVQAVTGSPPSIDCQRTSARRRRDISRCGTSAVSKPRQRSQPSRQYSESLTRSRRVDVFSTGRLLIAATPTDTLRTRFTAGKRSSTRRPPKAMPSNR